MQTKRKIKKALYFSAMLAAFFAVSFFGNAKAAERFSDVKQDDWFYLYVDALTKQDVVKGISDAQYAPQGTFTVAECAAVITRYLGLESSASEYAEKMGAEGIVGQKWYEGYLRLMYEQRIMDARDIGSAIEGAGFDFSPDFAERPVLRHEFARFISRSFELSGTGPPARNAYFESGGLGHEFIVGGAYDRQSYEAYAADIADYASIPEQSRQDILKAYYNGIFNGDEAGNFNPYSPLTRAEMAKVIAVVIDMQLRQREEYRTIPEGLLPLDHDYITLADGTKSLSMEAGSRLLTDYARLALSVSRSAQQDMLTYTHLNILPPQYAAEVYLEELSGGIHTEKGFVGLSVPGAQDTPYTLVASTGQNGYSVLLLLRNLSQKGRIEGAIYVVPGAGGEAEYHDAHDAAA